MIGNQLQLVPFAFLNECNIDLKIHFLELQ